MDSSETGQVSKQASLPECLTKHIKLKLLRKDREGPFIPVKGTVNPEDITVLNIYVSN